jgi:hypothetical protein
MTDLASLHPVYRFHRLLSRIRTAIDCPNDNRNHTLHITDSIRLLFNSSYLAVLSIFCFVVIMCTISVPLKLSFAK